MQSLGLLRGDRPGKRKGIKFQPNIVGLVHNSEIKAARCLCDIGGQASLGDGGYHCPWVHTVREHSKISSFL